ncbi:serine hydrolase [Robbsia sp. KACC 23696]|uniref:serine hydrolase n=1 Tax=Robbsia sp. KACC 23696 TaxID=3149231 RepID=UPI00325BF01B
MTGLAAPSALLLSLSLCLSIAAMVWPHVTFAQDARTAHRSPHRAAAPAVKSRPHAQKPPRSPHGRTTHHRTHVAAPKPTLKATAKPKAKQTLKPRHHPRTTPAHTRIAKRPSKAQRATRHAKVQVPRVSPSAATAAALMGATAEARGPIQTRVAPSGSLASRLAPSGPTLLARCGYTPHARHALRTRAIYVRDARSGKVLLTKDATRVRPIASLSKMMTAVVARDSHRPLSDKLTVTAADKDYIKFTHSRLKVGSTLSRADMFHIALMSSENRAAAALSRDYPGGRPAFMQAMNAKARALGMRRTHFDNPTGLSPHNVSTAEDLAKLVDHAALDPLLRRFSTDKWDIVHPGHGELVYVNSNRLVRLSHWPVALQKTGFINEAGHSMMMRLDVHGHPITMVLLGSPTPQGDVDDAIKIRHWLDCSLQS